MSISSLLWSFGVLWWLQPIAAKVGATFSKLSLMPKVLPIVEFNTFLSLDNVWRNECIIYSDIFNDILKKLYKIGLYINLLKWPTRGITCPPHAKNKHLSQMANGPRSRHYLLHIEKTVHWPAHFPYSRN